jgi:hypothetical protein
MAYVDFGVRLLEDRKATHFIGKEWTFSEKKGSVFQDKNKLPCVQYIPNQHSKGKAIFIEALRVTGRLTSQIS